MDKILETILRFFQILKAIFEILDLIASMVMSVIYMIRRYQRKKILEKYFPVVKDYMMASQPNTDSWRWRFPTAFELQIEDTETKSILHIHSYLLKSEKNTTRLGYLIIIANIFIFSAWVYHRPDSIFLIFTLGLIGILGIATLMMTERVTQVILQPKRVTIVLNFGFWFKRKVHFKLSKHWSFKGSYQSIYGMGKDQKIPHYMLIVTKKTFLGRMRFRYLICCNQSKGSWISAGLNHRMKAQETS